MGMYHQCKLVHGDLSEYNMLYHQGDAFIIDVSQSVEHDHPHALEFLRKDLHNVTEFFKKLGVAVLGLRELFDWVVDARENWEERLDALAEVAAERTEAERDAQAVVDEEVFKQVFIPRNLADVAKPDMDIQQSKKKGSSALNYGAVTGISHANNKSDGEDEEDEEGSSEEEGEENSDDENEEKREKFVSSARPKHEDKDEKKERKKAIREAKADKRKEKVPKHLKKRKEQAGRSKVK